MKTLNFGRIMTAVTALFMLMSILFVLPSGALAQRGDDRSARANRSQRRHYSKSDVLRVVRRVEDRSDAFKKAVDKSLDRSYLNKSRREDRINDRVKDFDKAIDRFRKSFDRRDRWDDSRSDFRDILEQARPVDRLLDKAFDNKALPGRVRADWSDIRSDLNWLADAFNLPGLARIAVPPVHGDRRNR